MLLLALAATAGWAASRPALVTVDGVEREVRPGATIQGLGPDAFTASAGDLIAIDGTVAKARGGQPARILRNGQPATRMQRLYNGDVLVSRPGADQRESLETTEVPIPFVVGFEGEGSLMEERVPGKPGARLVTRGAQSGVEVSSTVLREPSDAVVQKIRPKPGAKIVALTFDDGPWPVFTDKVLDILEAEQVPATFFMLGTRVNRAPSIARRVVAEGHQAASHTLGHRYLSREKPKEVRRQIRGGRSAIKKHTGTDTRWLRPPYGAMSGAAWKVVKTEKVKVVMWDVDPKDWKKTRKAKAIANSAVKHAKPGSIILLHDGGGDRTQTVKALPIIIRKLKAKGYSFVTVEELYAVKRTAKDR
jgi:peptidoglycan/xylan/chitin deacetylase (PgdA/CDA1 family)